METFRKYQADNLNLSCESSWETGLYWFLLFYEQTSRAIETRYDYENLMIVIQIKCELLTINEDPDILPGVVIIKLEKELSERKKIILEKVFDVYCRHGIEHIFKEKVVE